MNLTKVLFDATDKLPLSGLLYNPDTKTDKVVIFIHGIHSNCLKKKDDVFGEELTNNNVAYFTFNNRGANTVTKINGKFYGAAYEDPKECIYDIDGAIDEMKSRGFTKIHILGHSLGSSKVLYWYKNAKEHNVETVGFLSLVDMNGITRAMLGQKYDIMMQKLMGMAPETLIPPEALENISILPLSVKTFKNIFVDEDFNLISYIPGNVNVTNIDNIKEPVFIRFATINEFLIDTAPNTVQIIMSKLNKNNIDISYIDNADHSYHGREKELIDGYIRFICGR
ncbi:MAG: alpha/beta hydrolase [Clostridia bacterium]|nr:alpha/beta hydrolase [Clostridia bacterium]